MKYAVKKEFGLFRHFRPPMKKRTLRVAKAALSLCPKGMRTSGSLTVEKRKTTPSAATFYLIKPKQQAPLPVVLYLHGGGFVFRGAPYHYRTAKEYALRSNSAVAFVDYRLAFDSPFGAPLADCLAVYRELLQNAERLGLEHGRTIFAGDSAGAYLCLALMQRCREENLPLPEKLLLVYPVVDPNMTTESMKVFVDTPMWNARCNAEMWRYYSHGKAVFDPLGTDLSDFPPTYIETAQFDCLHDEGVLLAEKLTEAGVPCVLRQTSGTMHGFDICLHSPTARDAIAARLDFLNRPYGEITC